jgi:hypothetical protein
MNTTLDKIITLFEEKSRNYTGIDFSGALPGVKLNISAIMGTLSAALPFNEITL